MTPEYSLHAMNIKRRRRVQIYAPFVDQIIFNNLEIIFW